MKTNRLFLTSSMIMAIATFPAISEDYYNSDIANSCQVNFLGGTGADNSTAPNSFQAQYEAIEYDIDAGQYLAADAITGTQCPANSFCPGGTYTFNEDDDQGIESCPTGFTLSNTGSSAQTDCYRECTTNDVAHSASVGGGYYYGNNNQCGATLCETGYHRHNTPFVNIDIDGSNVIGYATNTGVTEGGKTASDYNLTQNGSSFGVSFNGGDIIGVASCNGTPGNDNYGYYDNDISNWTRPGDTFNQGGTGDHCWCKITGYIPTGGTLQSVSSSPWVYNGDGGGGMCESNCADYCANYVRISGRFNRVLLGVVAITDEPSSCVANTINVEWYDNDGNLHETNQCTYDGAITLPDAPEKRGHTFKGWKLVWPRIDLS